MNVNMNFMFLGSGIRMFNLLPDYNEGLSRDLMDSCLNIDMVFATQKLPGIP